MLETPLTSRASRLSVESRRPAIALLKGSFHLRWSRPSIEEPKLTKKFGDLRRSMVLRLVEEGETFGLVRFSPYGKPSTLSRIFLAGPTGFEPRGVRNLVSSGGLDSIVLS